MQLVSLEGGPQLAVRCLLVVARFRLLPCGVLPPLAGAAALHRPLIQAVEAFGAQPPYQQPLLGTVGSILGAPAGRQLAALRGGDADPEAAQALLSLLGCCLRQACQWRQVAAAAELEGVLQLGLPLAVANTACHHKVGPGRGWVGGSTE